MTRADYPRLGQEEPRMRARVVKNDEEQVQKRIRLLISDAHALLREGLQKVFEPCSDIEVAGKAADFIETMQLVHELKPDILLLDLAKDDLEGLQLIRRISRTCPVRTILLTDELSRKATVTALNFGASAVLPKKSSFEELLSCIRSVHAGQSWARQVAAMVAVDAPQDASRLGRFVRSRFTDRENDVITGIVAGHSNKEIAARFSISAQTVKHHLRAIFVKTGVSSRLELALYVRGTLGMDFNSRRSATKAALHSRVATRTNT
jgi:two-component system nitrate/nitrite response regulator NarL